MKHTPGPWRTSGLPEGRGHFGIWSDSGSVASVTKARNGSRYAKPMLVEEGHANARLIAAAPEMYEALTDVLGRYVELVDGGDCGNWDQEKEAEVIAARKAIAKAETGNV